MPIEITDEMRRAVLGEACEQQGHMFDMSNVVSGTNQMNPADGRHTNVLRARDTSQMPHILCGRCGSVWIVLDTPGYGYDDAHAQLASRLGTTPDELKPQPRLGIEIPFPAPVDGTTPVGFGHGHGH
jgi:hypothetical protein